jgi:Phosphatidylserine/phosphatidylglycerophosphate/cardiolipin synthases and related enzymes
MTAWNIILIILEITYVIVVLSIILKVVSQNRNPLKTTSWILLLLLVPLLGICIYYLFGQDARQIRIISNKKYKLLQNRASAQPAILPNDTEEKGEYKTLVQLFHTQNKAPLLQGSIISIYTTGEDKFKDFEKDLETAQHHIHLQYYIFADDEIGNRIQSILIRKAQEGVKVRILYDDVGNWKTKKAFYKRMTDAGVEVTGFLQVKFPILTSKVNYRNHRKVVIIDGKIGYVGGMNIADRYLSPTWRDTHIRIEGRGVLGLQSAFLIDWYSSGKNLISDIIYFPPLSIKTENLMQVVTGGPISRWRTLLQATIQIITNAKNYVYIQTPYFLPEDSLVQAIQLAALGGIDIRLMVPEKADTHFVGPASRSYYTEMLEAGVKIHTLKDAFLHSKLIVSDDKLSVIGSANMDFRSFEHNFEINTYIYDLTIASQLKEIYLKDQQNCSPVKLDEWKKRPRGKKLQESLLRLFSPLF